MSRSELSNGRKVRELEIAIAEHLDIEHVVATSSGTIALYMMFRAFGMAGKRIAMPAFTWRSTAEAALMAGARPVFLDIKDDTLCLDANLIDYEVDAICVNEVFGCPADYDELSRHGIPMFADGASAFGSQHDYWVDVTARIYSLSPTKVLTANEGGLIATNNESVAQEMRSMRRWSGRMTEYNAACALNGLKYQHEILAEKREIASYYEQAISHLNLSTQIIPENCRSTRKDIPVFFETKQERDAAQEHLEAVGIETRIYFTPAYEFLPFLSYEKADMSITVEKFNTGLCIPCYPGVDCQSVVDAIEEAVSCQDGKRQKTKSAIG